MNILNPLVIIAVPATLLLGGLPQANWANRHPVAMRVLVTGLAMASFVLSMIASLNLAFFGPQDFIFASFSNPLPISFGVYFDSLTAIMLLLVSFIGCIISRYSQRYLDGEPTQGRFMKWISFTLGAVLLMIVSNNLVMFTVAWMLTSLALHQLLTHYRNRPSGMLAARKKFLYSRIGDSLLIAALVLTFKEFGTFEYSEIFRVAKMLASQEASISWSVSSIGALYVLGAMTKSAQFPFHSWLPDTMETPTPVSALMHAGIINAGGFLVIRLSPLVSLSHLALDFLALVGAFTALFGSIVMLTQTSIKRSLAYSTIAQMGFMMLQCGLGAFSAAVLHIVAHSLYKAHAFLSTGSVLDAAARLELTPLRRLSMERDQVRSLSNLMIAATFAIGIHLAMSGLSGSHAIEKSGQLILGMIMILALTQLLWNALDSRQSTVILSSLTAAVMVSASYFAAFSLFDYLLTTSVSHTHVSLSLWDKLIVAVVAIGFLGTFAVQVGGGRLRGSPILKILYVHASNGFYIDIVANKFTARFPKRFAPVK